MQVDVSNDSKKKLKYKKLVAKKYDMSIWLNNVDAEIGKPNLTTLRLDDHYAIDFSITLAYAHDSEHDHDNDHDTKIGYDDDEVMESMMILN